MNIILVKDANGMVTMTYGADIVTESYDKFNVALNEDNTITFIIETTSGGKYFTNEPFTVCSFDGAFATNRADADAKIYAMFRKMSAGTGGGGGGIISVTGNIVNNTDPLRPVVTATVNTRTPNPAGNITVKTDSMMAAEILGSQIKAECVGMDIGKINSGVANAADGTLRIIGFYIREACTITGARWFQNAAGVYVADNYNGIGLYTISGGVLTLVASSVDDGNLWKASPFTWVAKNFSPAYPASVGLLYLGMLYNNSSQTTAPTFGCSPNMSSGISQQSDFANSAKLFAFNSGNNTLPTNLAMSACPGATVMIYAALY